MKTVKATPALRVWGITMHMPSAFREKLALTHSQARAIVAAKSRAAAARALGATITERHLKEYGSVTGNAEEVALANARYPEVSYTVDHSKLWFDINGDRVAVKAKRRPRPHP